MDIPVLRDDDRAIGPGYANIDERYDVIAFGCETQVLQAAEVECGGNARQQCNVPLLVEGAAPGKLGRHQQLEILIEAVAKAGDGTARASVVEAANELTRSLGFCRRIHC